MHITLHIEKHVSFIFTIMISLYRLTYNLLTETKGSLSIYNVMY